MMALDEGERMDAEKTRKVKKIKKARKAKKEGEKRRRIK
jgi:hypothetical protein